MNRKKHFFFEAIIPSSQAASLPSFLDAATRRKCSSHFKEKMLKEGRRHGALEKESGLNKNVENTIEGFEIKNNTLLENRKKNHRKKKTTVAVANMAQQPKHPECIW